MNNKMLILSVVLVTVLAVIKEGEAGDDCFQYDKVLENGETMEMSNKRCDIAPKSCLTDTDLECMIKDAYEHIIEDGKINFEKLEAAIKTRAEPEDLEDLQNAINSCKEEEKFASCVLPKWNKLCPKDRHLSADYCKKK